ncbi:dTDP-fucopyranose mutase [Vermiconidia calcicola]|uniref:dTDP-fucopyranose mutase n=1 Tax=Vermiconidia calcicola TaxID=1690605 RepID=A0ACC3NBP5_9PEZI|nr:dTDP-fucopyranose mutase [Vermiconidia calcicola]
MAAVAMSDKTSRSHNDEDLTDEQIEQLLARATARLQEKSKSKDVVKLSEGNKYTFPKLETGRLEQPYVSTKDGIATLDSPRLLDEKHRKQANGVRKVEGPLTAKKLAQEKKQATAGSNWYDLPKTNLTPEFKRDLQLLKMRGVLDPHRHYKKDGGSKMKAPEYSQVGTIVEGPTEFFTGRIEKKKRKRTFVEEVLAGEQETGRFRKKYGDLQDRKGSGKKAYYKALKAKRTAGGAKGAGGG